MAARGALSMTGHGCADLLLAKLGGVVASSGLRAEQPPDDADEKSQGAAWTT
jgi:hypothetical protein